MKLSKTKKIILLTSGTGILIASIITPIVVINSEEEDIKLEDQQDVKKVIQLLEEKSNFEKIIILSYSSKGKIVANNQKEIILKLKELVGASNLKGVKIEISMQEDQTISTNRQKIIVKISKGNFSKTIDSSKSYFVKKYLNQDEEEIAKIKLKIKNKNLIIPKDIRTFSDNEILLAIKNQLKINNPSLTNNDLSKITDNIWHLKPGKKTLVILKIELNGLNDLIKINVTKEKNIKLWTKNSAIILGSSISNGVYSTSSFIQDSSGNFWAMGKAKNSKLQVLRRDGLKWENSISSGLTKGSNIKNGTNGVIFEDDFGNIWSMGFSSRLQVLVKKPDGTFADSWVNNNNRSFGNKLLKNSAIRFGVGGSIFQDSFGNLWALGGWNAKLQVLLKKKDGTYVDSWICDNKNGLLKNSKIVNVPNNRYLYKYGKIFQDSFGNLWAMGNYSKLQVLKVDPNSPTGYVNTGWTNDNSLNGDKLLKKSNIIIGHSGTIFQDSFGNLWTSGGGQQLQVLKAKPDGSGYVDTGWNCNNTEGLLKGSNIVVVGRSGNPVRRIFQDSFGNLWIQGMGKFPQVLKANKAKNGYVETGWINNNTKKGLLKNLRISDNGWVFFQDSSKNLWAMGNGTKLQVLKAKPDGSGYVDFWTNSITQEKLLKDSNINNGFEGKIFEDSSKNIWSMGYNSKLQVYDKTQEKWIS